MWCSGSRALKFTLLGSGLARAEVFVEMGSAFRVTCEN